RDAMAHRVLNERLEHEWRYATAPRRVGCIDGPAQPLSIANLFNRQILLGEVQSLIERNLVCRVAAERSAKQLAELFEHRLRLGGIFPQQRRDGVEHVEEKVRPELAFKVRQP